MLRSIRMGVTIIGLAFIVISQCAVIRKQSAEIDSQSRNLVALAGKGEYYKTGLGESAHKIKVLETDYKSLKEINEGLYTKIRTLEVDKKRLESAFQSISSTDVTVGEILKRDPGDYLTSRFSDPYLTVENKVVNDTISTSILMRDTITGVLSITPKRFLFIKWGIKSVDFDVSNTNPHVLIFSQMAVKFKK